MTCRKHVGCTKRRSAELTHEFGRVEPVAYLYAWSEMDVSAEEHGKRDCKPLDSEVAKRAFELGHDYIERNS